MRKSGQITVFLSLVMLCVCSLVCGLVESARTAGAGWYLKMAADSAMDSVFSGYHRAAWEQYRLFLLEYEDEDEPGSTSEAYGALYGNPWLVSGCHAVCLGQRDFPYYRQARSQP